MEFTKEIIEQFYKTHTLEELCQEFNLSYYKTAKLLKAYNIEIKKINGVKLEAEKKLNALIQHFSYQSLMEFYQTRTNDMAAEELGVSKNIFVKLLNHFDIPAHSAIEAKRIIYTKKYGSYEAGKAVEQSKIVANTDQNKRQEKANITNQKKYGGNSPFSSPAVRNKAKNTLIAKYGVNNSFQIPEVIDTIHNTQLEKYGGIGFASEELMQKYKDTMILNYGVEYGCLTDNCKKASHSKNSKPNTEFSELLEKNNINYSREFSVDNYNYDFKVGNNLIEINPSYTHNSTYPFRNTDKIMDKNYHINKYTAALNNNYRCICIWDWDDVEKIVQLLKNRNTIYARKCTISIVDKSQSKEFINKYHLQGYSKSEIDIGLYYDNNLVSIMTFGKPRYNKNFEYELIRYCSSENIIGGAEKLFKYFLNTYKPNNIISYCDNSKFNGNTYLKLGFKKDTKKIYPSKHWYNIKTKQHITDNFLRQRGFDQLFGTNYGKGTSNNELMIKYGFVEIYDCGQSVYKYFNK